MSFNQGVPAAGCSRVHTGQVSVTNTATQLPNRGGAVIRICNHDTAAGGNNIYYGDTAADLDETTGAILLPGYERIVFVDNLNRLYVFADVGNPILSYEVYH